MLLIGDYRSPFVSVLDVVDSEYSGFRRIDTRVLSASSCIAWCGYLYHSLKPNRFFCLLLVLSVLACNHRNKDL